MNNILRNEPLEKEFKIFVENSAPSQSKPAKSVIWSSPILSSLGVSNIVDVGCGRLRNLCIYRQFFTGITLMDTVIQCERIKDFIPKSKKIKLINNKRFSAESGQYDAAFIISVFHIMPDPKSRTRLLKTVINKVVQEGYIIVDVPCGEHYYRRNCRPENRFNDGWAMGKGIDRTFYKNYSAVELDSLLLNRGDLKLFKKIWYEKHLIRIMQKIK